MTKRKLCPRCKKLIHPRDFKNNLKLYFIGVTFHSSWKECSNCGHRFVSKIEVLKVQKSSFIMGE
jgi:ribosomal protein S27AE